MKIPRSHHAVNLLPLENNLKILLVDKTLPSLQTTSRTIRFPGANVIQKITVHKLYWSEDLCMMKNWFQTYVFHTFSETSFQNSAPREEVLRTVTDDGSTDDGFMDLRMRDDGWWLKIMKILYLWNSNLLIAFWSILRWIFWICWLKLLKMFENMWKSWFSKTNRNFSPKKMPKCS